MDWLDRLSSAAIVGLALVTISMLANHRMTISAANNPGEGGDDENNRHALQMELDKETYQEVKSQMDQGLYEGAMAKLQGVMKQYPENPRSYVYLAKLDLAEGKLGDAIHSYRRAVEMEPDYVDKEAPLFIGDQIKKVVVEGREKFGREKALRPKDEDVGKALEDVYYLQSRLAGGCE